MRRIFAEMLTIGSPTQIAANLSAEGITTKAWTTQDGQAHDWQRLLDEGKIRSMTDIAAAEGIDVTQARKEAEKFRKLAQSWSSRARGKDPRVRMAA